LGLKSFQRVEIKSERQNSECSTKLSTCFVI
jgi:hypothetical protein